MRAEFSKPTKREALKRSGGICEASGTLYGLQPGERCQNKLSYGVIFDHVDPDANSHDNSLANCLAICPRCNRFKTPNDIRNIAKTVRQQDKHSGIRNVPSRPLPGTRASGLRRRMNGQVERW